jgi:hypothetical protein
MNRLQTELHRLYVPEGCADPEGLAETPRLIDADGRVRAMVLELARPADWAALSRVWQGVQADLELPAPAIAVSGIDGLQLWFSLAQAVPAARAAAFLEALRVRWLGDIRVPRLRLMPAPDSSLPLHGMPADLVPAALAPHGPWSAFVAPDLAGVFADEPWLDIPPSPEGQADQLSRLRSMPLLDFERAQQQLDTVAALTTAKATEAAAASVTAPAATAAAAAAATQATSSLQQPDPMLFLQAVMNDTSVPLALRIEAAKALLHGAAGPVV